MDVKQKTLSEKIQLLVRHSQELKEKIDTAKTKTKKKFYQKKLKKNNERVSKYLLYIDQINRDTEDE